MNKTLLKSLFVGVFTLIVASSAFAQTNYYVSTTGNNGNSGLTGNPKLTIQSALDAINAIPLVSRDANGYIVNVSAGTFNEAVTIKTPKTTLKGAGSGTAGNAAPATVDAAVHTVISGAGLGTTKGITFSTTLTDVTIQDLVVTAFGAEGMYLSPANSDRLTIKNVNVNNCSGQAGLYVSGPINTVLIENVASVSNANRAIVVWNGFKKNVTIQNNYVLLGGCCGIELQDGTASGVKIDNNTVVGGAIGDSGIAAIGLKSGAGASVISNNNITMSKRYGIEIKNPAGSGSEDETQDGTIVLKSNTITRTGAMTETRDLAGIAIFRRAFTPGNPSGYIDVPSGVVVKNNTISGFAQPDVIGEGYGVVAEGVRMTIKNNTISGNDIGIQRQAGNPSNYVKNDVGDADQVASGSPYFNRGNSPYSSAIIVTGNTLSSNGTDTQDQFAANSYFNDNQYVLNSTTMAAYATINLGAEYALDGETITLPPYTFDELVVVNKGITIDGVDKNSRTLKYTGTVTGMTTPALFKVTVPNVTIKNIAMQVDLTKLWSGIISSGEVSGLSILNNNITATRTAATNAASYTDRNAIGINIVGRTIPGVSVVNNPTGMITVQGNTIAYSPDGGFGIAAFRAGVAADNYAVTVGGNNVSEGNTIQTINHDVTARFQTGTSISVLKNNTFNGGGIEMSEPNGGALGVTVENNTFDYTLGAPTEFALVRFKNNNANIPYILKNNIVKNNYWLVSLENFQNVQVDGNAFTPVLDASSTFKILTINTKTNSSSANTKLPISATIINNTFNGVVGQTGGKALAFYNHDNNSPQFGTFVVGQVGKQNIFNNNIDNYIYIDNSNGVPTKDGSNVAIPGYPEYAGNISLTTTGYWTPNIRADQNQYYIAGLMKVPGTFSASDRTAFEGKVFDKLDDANIGLVQYYFPIRNLNTTEGFATLQDAIDGVETLAGHVINVDAGTYTLTTGVQIIKGVTLRGNNNTLAAKPIINGVGNSTNKALFEVNAANVKIQNFEFQISQTGDGMIGVATTATDNFNNLEVADNTFKGMKAFTTGYVFGSYGMKLGRGSAGFGTVPKNSVSVVRNNITYNNMVAPEFFGRGIYAYNVSGKIGGANADANSMAAVFALQAGEIGDNGTPFEFSYNQVPGGLVSVFGADAGNHLINNNTIGSGVTLTLANSLVRMLEIKGNRTAGANIEVANNTISNYINIGAFIQRSSNVTVKNNTFTPLQDASNTNFSSIVFSSKEGTSGSSSPVTSQNLTITGNTFNGSGTAGGAGITFYNHEAGAGVKPLTGAKVGGTGSNKNTFNASHAAYIVLDATPTGTTASLSALYDEPQVAANTTNILPFDGDIDAAYNTFGAINSETETNFDNLVTAKGKITDGVDNGLSGYVNIQPSKAFIATLGNLTNGLLTVPDNFTLIVKNDPTLYSAMGTATVGRAHTFAIDGNAASAITFGALTVNAAAKEVKFTNPASVSGAFTLTAGKVTPTAGLTLNGTVNTTKGAGNFVNGDLTVNGVTSNVLFPVGKTNASYVELTNVTGTSSNFTIKYFNSTASSTGTFDPTLGSISTSEYWDVNRTSGTVAANVKLYTYDAAASNLSTFDQAHTSVAWYNGSTWKDQGNASNSSNPGTVEANVLNTNFGLFTFAKTVMSTLPVSLIDFSATATTRGALLKWSTSSETNNLRFEIEKSEDGKNFSLIAQKTGAGTSLVRSNYEVTDGSFRNSAYYRLSQIDVDGKKTTYDKLIRYVKGLSGDATVTVYPNPTTSSVFVNMNSTAKEKVQVKVVDVAGKIFKTVYGDSDQQIEIDMNKAMPGIYTLQLISGSGSQFKKIVKQ